MNSMPLLVAAVFLMCSMVSSISDGILTDIGSTMEKESVTLEIRDQSHSPLVITIEEDGEVRSSLEKPSTTKATRSKRFRYYIIVEEIVDDKQPDEEESDSPSTESASTTAALTTSPAEGRRLKEFQQDKWKQPYPWWISDLIAAQIRSEYERLTSTPMPSIPVNHTNTNDTNTTAPIPIIPSWWPSSNHTLPSTATPTIVPSPAPSNDLIAQATSW